MNGHPKNITVTWILALWMSGAIGSFAQHTFSGTGDWNDTARWSSGVIPGDGTDVVIDGAVTLTNSTARLASYTLDGGRTNTFRGTNTALRATIVTINGTIPRHPADDSLKRLSNEMRSHHRKRASGTSARTPP